MSIPSDGSKSEVVVRQLDDGPTRVAVGVVVPGADDGEFVQEHNGVGPT